MPWPDERLSQRTVAALGRRTPRHSLREYLAPVLRRVPQRLFDPQQLVVFRDAVGARGGASLNLPGAQADSQVGDGGIFGFAAAVADDAGIAMPSGQLDGVDRLGERADLVHLD